MNDSHTLGFCGIGLMGAPMVRRLLAAGHRVHVWNRSPAKAQALVAEGALLAAAPAELAERCDTVLLCLTDQKAVQATVFGADGIAQAKRARALIDHSSIAPDAARDFAARLQAANGMDWIDAPVSGGVKGAEAGTLAIMAGGRADTLARLEPVMRAYAARVTHMGEVGAGQVTKLCNQTIVATTLAAISEAVALAQANGIDAAKFTEALAGGWADSTLLQIFVPRMTGSNTPIIGALRIMQKDVDNVAACAGATATPMPVLSATQQSYRLAASQGWGDADLSEIVRVAWPRRGQAEQG